eukprot:Nitzschia sp. Nitz4//scaffold78_size91513//55130//57271//NITZ4_004933-RA/size91513-processed-gene-0.93-mRNA-1//-1//CDS//3329558142//1951//frame0
MGLLPAHTTPILLLKWTEKALSHEGFVGQIKKLLEEHQLIVLPTASPKTVGLTASQKALEEQAERDHLVKPRKIPVSSESGNVSSEPFEIIQDHFQLSFRKEFGNVHNNAPLLDDQGLFTEQERCQLVLGLLDEVFVSQEPLLELLQETKTAPTDVPSRPRQLHHLLHSHDWIEVLTPVHTRPLQTTIQKKTWFPLLTMMPPTQMIQDYYGPEIAYYFAFMGFLGTWLFRLGLLGAATFLFRLYRNDIIDEDEYTPFYGIACFLWAILLCRFWERQEYSLAYQWGTLDITQTVDEYQRDLDLTTSPYYAHRRPEFQGTLRISPVTGQQELFYPGWKRKVQYIISAVVTGLLLAVAFSVMILSLNLQGYIRPKTHYHPFHIAYAAAFADEGALFDSNHSIKSLLPVVLHAGSILCLNTLYRKVAEQLTEWENHETQTAHDNSLILKRFLFEAFDCYIALFYLAFYERDVEKLRSELVAVFNVDTLRRLATEVILPYLRHRYLDPATPKQEDHSNDLLLDEYESFDDYMEILIQFGYVTLFASAYPMASLVMSLAVWVEIRSDMYKLAHLCQKPLIRDRVQDIGVWKQILQFMVWFSCLTNCLLFGFTSDQMMHYLPNFYTRDAAGDTYMVNDKGWLVILVIFGLERSLIVLGLILNAMIPMIPEELKVMMQRRIYLLSKKHTKKND